MILICPFVWLIYIVKVSHCTSILLYNCIVKASVWWLSGSYIVSDFIHVAIKKNFNLFNV